MRVGIDAREVMGRPTGVGRYLGELLREWAAPAEGVPPRHEFFLYSPAPLADALLAQCEGLRPVARVVRGGGGTAWEQTSLASAARADGLDVFFAPAYTAPLRVGVPVVLTIHDLSFAAHPEWFRWREGLRRRWLTRWSGRLAARVLTDSEFSASEIERHLGVPQSSIRVIPLGVTPPPGSRSSAMPIGTTRGPVVLYVGSIFNRRRVPDLIRAFAAVARDVPAAKLVVIGENRTHPYEDLTAIVHEAGVSAQTSLRAYVSDDELAEAYRQASVFAFLSEYEGFGLTPLEALTCGIPAVVLDTPVAREVCGDAACYVPRGDLAATSAALARLLSDPAARAGQLAGAAQVLARYSWPRAARETMAAIEEAAR